MNTNEEMIFDELMRQKLGNYSELPDMAMMDNIHAKKNRIIKLYRLTKMFSVLCIIGLSLFGIYMLVKPTETAVSQNNQIENRTTANLSKSNNYTSTNIGNSSAKYTSTNSSKNILNFANKSGTKPIQKTDNTTQISSTHFNKIDIRSNSTIKNSTPKNISSSIDQVTNSTKKDSINVKQNEQNVKSKEVSVNCKAAFDYYVSYDGKYNFTNFSETDASAKMMWDFGDGTISDLSSPNHVYKNTGNYIVTLKVSDITNSCNDVLQKSLAFNSSIKQPIQNISIKGRVVAGSDDVNKGNVSLMLFNSDKNSYSQLAKANISLSGEYSFNDLKTGTYLVLADANNPKYIPTYWGNSTNMTDAIEIHIMENDVDDLVGLNISLTNNTQFNNNDLSHNFSRDTSIQNYVLVIDQNNNVVGKAKIDINGNVNLGDYPPGNYILMNPQTGNTNPVKVTPGGVTIGGGPVGIATGNITLIPNPAINDVKFSIDISETNQVAEIMIMNETGSMVYHKNFTCSAGSYPFDIDISNLPAGEYYVVVNVGGSQTLSGRMIKSGNNSSNNR